MQRGGELLDGKRLAVQRHHEVRFETEHGSQAGEVMLASLGEPVLGAELVALHVHDTEKGRQ